MIIACVPGILALVPRIASAGEIADVHSLAQLKAVEPIHMASGWDIRLGISDGGAEAGPWDLIYCLVDWNDGDRPIVEYAPNDFGPVHVQVAFDSPSLSEANRAERDMASMTSAHRLYINAFPVAWKCTCYVHAYLNDRTPVAQKKIDISSVKPCYWATVATYKNVGDPGDVTKPVAQFVHDSYAAMPGFPSMLPAVLDPAEDSADNAKRPAGNYLPGAVPVNEHWISFGGKPSQATRPIDATRPSYPVSVQIEGGVFRIARVDGQAFGSNPRNLLARWWLNDKPVEAPRATHQLFMEQATQMLGMWQNGTALSIEEGIPAWLGAVKAGDVVGVQFLCSAANPSLICENATSQFGMMQQLEAVWNQDRQAQIPLLSNKITFAVTPQLLAAATTTPSSR